MVRCNWAKLRIADLASEPDRFLGTVDSRSYKSGEFFMTI